VPRYWNDANVFIEAHQKSYPVEMAESFWNWMSARVDEGTIVCPRRVYQEIAENEDREDALAKWFQSRRERGLCIKSDEEVQRHVGIVTEYVFTKYQSNQAIEFSKGGDSWVIAHAMADNGIVVTQESNLHPNSLKARIPDVCKYFNVPFMGRMQMLKVLGARF
jgi:hypothetical protein